MPLAPSINHPFSCGNFSTEEPSSVFAKQTIGQRGFDLTLFPQSRAVGPTQFSASITIPSYGAIVDRFTTEAAVQDVVASLQARGVTTYGATVLSSLTPGVASGSASLAAETSGFGVFSYESTGTAVIEAVSSNGFRARATLPIATGGDGSEDTWVDYSGTAENNLGKHLESQVVSRTGSVDIFSVMNHSAQTYVRNPAFWLADVDITSFSPWNSAGGQQIAGTLISPQFCICAEHFRPGVGTVIRFVGPSGQVVNRTVVAQRDGVGFDVLLVKLNAPITEHVTPCKVMPPGLVLPGDYYKYLPTASLINLSNAAKAGQLFLDIFSRPLVPAIICNQDKKCGLAVSQGLSGSWVGGGLAAGLNLNQPGRIYRESLDIQPLIRPGCSGSPVYLLINGELCLLGERYYTNSTGTCFTVATMYDAVQAAMDEMGSEGNDTLSPADLSAFTDFSS